MDTLPRPPGADPPWDGLRALAARYASLLPGVLAPGPGRCVVCLAPVPARYRRCFHCTQHQATAPGLLAGRVVPVSYAVSGGRYAGALWQYKTPGPERGQARAMLRAILLAFLHDHGPCLWAGGPAPSLLAAVPSGRGRPGEHPLRSLAGPYLGLPWVELAVRPGDPVLGRELNPERFRASGRLDGATVLLLEDTWASGASAQSAAVALRRAGAALVLTVVLGRHLNPADPLSPGVVRATAGKTFRGEVCALHDGAAAAQCRPVPNRAARNAA